MQIECCLLFLCGVLRLCSGQDINCMAAQEAEFTMYTISEVSRVSDVEPSDCEYSWTADHVIANHKEKNPELVLTHTINAIVTTKCFDTVIFKRNCISERESYMAYCAINCTLNAPWFQKHREFSYIWIGIVGVAAIFLVVLGILFFRECKSDAVKPKAADVEMGN
ncbi:uncharacterized protein LOC144535070 [Sander vitreus]